MTIRPGTSDLVVVGGGVVGLSVAWRAAAEGADVVLCDPAPGRGASRVAAGMLAPVTEARSAEAPLAELGLRSVHQWPGFARALVDDAGLGGTDDLGFRQEGTLQVAFDEDDRRGLAELAGVHRSLGLDSEPLGASDCRRLAPTLNPRVCAGLLVRGDWQVDPRRVVHALVAALARRGGRLRTAGVRRVLLRAGGGGGEDAVGGVELDDGSTISTSAVVLATGTGGPAVDLPLDVPLPVRPVKGEILRLCPGPVPPPLPLTVRASVHGFPVYLVPRHDGEVVVGATVREAGVDTSVRAGAVLELLRAAVDLVPVLGELELAEAAAGLRPTTPDNAPLLGPTAVCGLHAALGHFRHGVLLAPVTAEIVVGAVRSGRLAPWAEPFRAGRFGPDDPTGAGGRSGVVGSGAGAAHEGVQ